MLSNNTNKIVELFVESLLCGKISSNYARFLENGGNPEYVDSIYKMIKDWNQLHHKQNFSEGEDIDYMITSDDLYNVYIEGRIDGFIQGELVDETHENKIKQLENQLKQSEIQCKQLKEDNIRITNESHLKENELHDTRYMLDAYEYETIKKRDENNES